MTYVSVLGCCPTLEMGGGAASPFLRQCCLLNLLGFDSLLTCDISQF